MGVYEVTSPDGATYQVTAPDGASNEDIQAYAENQHTQQAPDAGAFQAATDKASNMATFGLGTAAGALGDMAADKVRGVFTGQPTQGYDDYLKLEKNRLDTAGDQHPVASVAGNLAGFFGNAPAKAAQGATQVVAPLWKQMASNAAIGGGINGTVGAVTTPGTWQDKATMGAVDTGLGAAFGGAAPAVIAGGSKLAAPLGKVIGAFTKDGQEKLAGRVLDEAANGVPLNPETAPIPGMELTTGQATNDPGVLWLERSMQQGNPRSALDVANAGTANNQAILNAARGVGDTSVAADAPEMVASGLQAAKDANKSIVNQTWKDAGIDTMGPVDTAPLKGAVSGYVSGLKKAEQGYIPADVKRVVGSFAPSETLDEIQALRSDLSSRATVAARAGNGNEARILGGLADVVAEHADNPTLYHPPTPEPPAAPYGHPQAEVVAPAAPEPINPARQAAYQQARAETHNFNQNFTTPQPVRNVLGVDKYGADKVPESATIDQFVKTGKGAPEAFSSFINAMKQAPKAVQKATMDAVRGHFAQKLIDATTNTALDQKGANMFSPAKMQKFVGDYDHVINSSLFTDAQRQLIKDIAHGTNLANRTVMGGPRGGSDTFAKISGGRFIDALLGGGGSTTAKLAAAGLAGVAGLHVGGPLGAIAGAAEGSHLTNKLLEIPKAKVMALLQDAMRDPKLARELQMKATAININYVSPRIAELLGPRLGQGAGALADYYKQHAGQ